MHLGREADVRLDPRDPICFITGHAAGAAAALAAADGCPVRDVDIPKLQKLLRRQEAYLG